MSRKKKKRHDIKTNLLYLGCHNYYEIHKLCNPKHIFNYEDIKEISSGVLRRFATISLTRGRFSKMIFQNIVLIFLANEFFF